MESETDAVATPGFLINGNVHGGVYPIQGATIRLMETQSNGYGGTAKTLLQTTSDQNGYFTFPDTGWSCDSGQFAYITVTSGHTANLGGGVMNNNVVQVGVIGPCSDLATQSRIDGVNVFVSEVSTVAAAYALGNFISVDSTNASSGQQIVNISAPANNNASSPGCTGTGSSLTCKAAGLAHGFTNAYNLVDSVRYDGSFPTGQARSRTPTNTVSAVPVHLINTIANVLQSCVDSVGGGAAVLSGGSYGSDGSHCGDLFADAAPPGGVAPTNTLQVVMDMAKYPTNNLTALFNLQPRATFFTPQLNGAPTSWTVSFFYGATASGSYVPYPVDLALDASDDVYVLYGTAGAPNTSSSTGTTNLYGAVFALGADGSQLYYGSHNASILYPSQIAVGSGGRVFVTNNDTTNPANGGLFATSTGSANGTLNLLASVNNGSGIAVDRANNVWVSAANSGGASMVEFLSATVSASTGSAAPDYQSSALGIPVLGLALDPNQDVWGIGGGNPSVTTTTTTTNPDGSTTTTTTTTPATSSSLALVANAGSSSSPAYPTSGTGGSLTSLNTYNGFSLAFNGAGTGYVPLNGELDTAASSAGVITPNANGTEGTSGSEVPHRSEVDGAGAVFWTDNEMSGLVYRYTPPSSGSLSSGQIVSFLPCFPYPTTSMGIQCITTSNSNSVYTPSNLRAMAIDSAGDIWYAADAGDGTVIETLGVAAPSWPQLSYGRPGVMPQ